MALKRVVLFNILQNTKNQKTKIWDEQNINHKLDLDLDLGFKLVKLIVTPPIKMQVYIEKKNEIKKKSPVSFP